MSHYAFTFHGEKLHALASGTLFWPAQNLLCVSDLHFGKAQRYAQHGSSALPPYETLDTLNRLDRDVTATGATTVVCLGDSFDRLAAPDELHDEARAWIARLQAGRQWVWIEGNHDPGPISIGGSHLAELAKGPIVFRHIARPEAQGEISGHYHPKVAIDLAARRVTRRCMVLDENRIVMPAYGTYTGGMSVTKEPLFSLFNDPALCVLSGASKALAMPRPALKRLR